MGKECDRLQPSISACEKGSSLNNDLDSGDQLQPGKSACERGDLASPVLSDTKAEVGWGRATRSICSTSTGLDIHLPVQHKNE
eukprot:2894164-Karenia_brevis.AAC.1